MEIIRLHATCVAKGNKGILLTGESGAGKSDLALRLMDRGAVLVADDRVEITRVKTSLFVNSPDSIAGLMEVRGLGIFTVKYLKKVKLSLVVTLCGQEWIDRLPFPEPSHILGREIPQIRLSAFELSAPIKIEMALASTDSNTMAVGALRE